MKTPSVNEYWNAFLSRDPALDSRTLFQSWYFGNSREMAAELAALVIAGKKTATACLARINELQPENAPIDNGYSVVTGFDGDALCIIQTAEIRHLPFNKVDAKFAFDEGEGDQSLDHWRKAHWEYFSREALENDFEFDEGSLICCERFRLLFS